MQIQLDQRPKASAAAAPQPVAQRKPAPAPASDRIDAAAFWARLGI